MLLLPSEIQFVTPFWQKRITKHYRELQWLWYQSLSHQDVDGTTWIKLLIRGISRGTWNLPRWWRPLVKQIWTLTQMGMVRLLMMRTPKMLSSRYWDLFVTGSRTLITASRSMYQHNCRNAERLGNWWPLQPLQFLQQKLEETYKTKEHFRRRSVSKSGGGPLWNENCDSQLSSRINFSILFSDNTSRHSNVEVNSILDKKNIFSGKPVLSTLFWVPIKSW